MCARDNTTFRFIPSAKRKSRRRNVHSHILKAHQHHTIAKKDMSAATPPLAGCCCPPTTVRDAAYWVRHLNLLPHPEGGYCREMNRGNYIVTAQSGRRRFAYSTIYFLLTPDSASHFHRLPSDEVWAWHAGDAADMHVIYRRGDDDHLLTRQEGEGDHRAAPRTDSESLPADASFVPPFLAERRRLERAARRRYGNDDDNDGNGSTAPDGEKEKAEEEEDEEEYQVYRAIRLGSNLEAGETLQYTVPAGAIFASSLAPPLPLTELEGEDNNTDTSSSSNSDKSPRHGYALFSCVVSPCFDFRDFELFTQRQLMAICPRHEAIIRELAYETLPVE